MTGCSNPGTQQPNPPTSIHRRAVSLLFSNTPQQSSIVISAFAQRQRDGDGANDICPALALGPDDVVLAKAGHALARYAVAAAADSSLQQIAARVCVWDTHEQLAQLVRQHVPRPDAAVHLQVSLATNKPHLRRLKAWLQRRCRGQIESLSIAAREYDSYSRCEAPQLPWSRLADSLRCLIFDGLTVVIRAPSAAAAAANYGSSSSSGGGGSDSDSALLLPPHLEQLSLNRCAITLRCLVQLVSWAPQLTSLKLIDSNLTGLYVKVGAEGLKHPYRKHKQQKPKKEFDNTAVETLFRSLPHLRLLHMRWPRQSQYGCGPEISLQFTCAVLPHLGSLQQLQDVSLTLGDSLSSVCDSLATSITSLTLVDERNRRGLPDGQLSPTLPPQLQQLSGLRRLDLSCCSFEPAVLEDMPGLQDLRLCDCFLLPCASGSSRQQPDGIAALLSALPSLTSLQSLSLYNMRLDTARAPHQHFSALTAASSTLTSLSLVSQRGRYILPEGAMQHIFLEDRPMPRLRRLELVAFKNSPSLQANRQSWKVMDENDLARMFTCCPGLTHLTLHEQVGFDRVFEDFTVLQLLPRSCKSLVLHSKAFEGYAAPHVAALSQLTSLSWQLAEGNKRYILSVIEQLTALRRLRKLSVQCDTLWSIFGEGNLVGNHQYGDTGLSPRHDLRLTPTRLKGPVWAQLLYLCTCCVKPHWFQSQYVDPPDNPYDEPYEDDEWFY